MQIDHDPGNHPFRGAIGLVVASLIIMTLVGLVAQHYLLPAPYAGVRLEHSVVYVSARRFETHGLELLEDSGTAINLTPWTAAKADAILKPPVAILVHGYNSQEHRIATYFADLIGYLREDARFAGSLLVLDWPARGMPLDELPTSQRVQLEMMSQNRPTWIGYEGAMYGGDQSTAEGVGSRSLLALLATLPRRHDGKIHIIAHSMGCYLTMHAMKEQPDTFAGIARMIWLAPDVPATVVSEPWIGNAVARLARGLSVHYSRNDGVLTGASRIANVSSRLGGVGPVPGAHPVPKLDFVDMTEDLGTGNVHGGYLNRGSTSARWIARELAAAR